MQHISENNMDELFQKAAENYPLRTDKSDWEKVAQKLESSSSASAVPRKFNRRWYLSVLAVLFLLTVGSFYTNFYFTNKKIIEIAQQKNNKPGKDTSPGNSIPYDNESQTTGYIEPVSVPIPNQKNSTANNYALTHGKRITTGRFNETFTLTSDTYDQATAKRRKKEKRDDNTNYLLNGNKVPAATDSYNTARQKKDNSSGQSQLSIPENKGEEKSISDTQKENTTANQSSGKKSNTGRFYVGVVLGPQLNQVKSQGFNKVGGELGLLFGYTLTEKISVESGLILSSKKYYSNGQYFNMEKISPTMPPSMKIIAVEGKATLLEFPLKGKYNLITKKNRNLFITAGATSYLLLHEQNDYQALVNGGQQDLKGDYGTMRKYFATSINLSVGYEKSIGERALIRVEPYLEFPLKGLGVGSMSVFGTGVHFGLTLPVRTK
jgi:hypothetical protein